MNRRAFLTQTTTTLLAASALPAIVPASVLGADKSAAPASRINLGCIGSGDRARDVMSHFLNQSNCRIAAVCDVKQNAIDASKKMVDGKYGNKDCASFGDYHELLANKDIEAVLIASTDNWHVLHALAAVRAGKDVYVEKPLSLSMSENQLLRAEVRKHRRVFQFGTQQRSGRMFRLACELARNEKIGKLKHVNVWAPASAAGGSLKEVPPPKTLNWDQWLGPATARPHTENITQNTTWWHVSDFALGFVAGWGIHPMDIALWGAGDLATGTVEVEGTGTFPSSGICDCATSWDIDLRFSTGLTMKFIGVGGGAPFRQQAEYTGRYGKIQDHGTAFEGSDGWVQVNRGGITMKPEELIDMNTDSLRTKLVRSPDHVKNFLDCIVSRQAPVSDIHSAVLADAFCHVPNLAMRLGRKLTYDIKAEKILQDEEANKRLHYRDFRQPWKLA